MLAQICNSLNLNNSFKDGNESDPFSALFNEQYERIC